MHNRQEFLRQWPDHRNVILHGEVEDDSRVTSGSLLDGFTSVFDIIFCQTFQSSFINRNRRERYMATDVDILALIWQYNAFLSLDVDGNVCKKKIHNSYVQIENSVSRVIVQHHSARLVMPNTYPCDRVFNPLFTTIKDSYSPAFGGSLVTRGCGRFMNTVTSVVTHPHCKESLWVYCFQHVCDFVSKYIL